MNQASNVSLNAHTYTYTYIHIRIHMCGGNVRGKREGHKTVTNHRGERVKKGEEFLQTYEKSTLATTFTNDMRKNT